MFNDSEFVLLDGLYEPTPDEFAGMLSELESKYSRAHLMTVLGLSKGFYNACASGRKDPGRLTKRIAWFLWMLEKAPDKLLSNTVMCICTWGKNTGKLPRISEMPMSERVKTATSFIISLRNNNLRYSMDEIAALCSLPVPVVRNVCSSVGYTPTNHDIIDLYTPGSLWYLMDWRKKDETLAREYNLPSGSIAMARLKLSEMPSAIVARNIYRTQGSNFNYFWCLWNDAKQIEVYNEALKIKAGDTGDSPNVLIDKNDGIENMVAL